MKVTAVSSVRREAKIVFPAEGQEDEVLNVVFNPMAYTAAFEQEVAEVAVDRPSEALVKATVELLLEWDLEDAEGQPIPLQSEPVSKVPIGVLAQIFRQIRMLSQPSSEEGKASDDGSPQAARSEGSLSGIH